MINVAIFPIPGAVNFPGLPIPLHVFEPRYRQMVKYCIDNEVMMGVCHTEKLVHPNKQEQTRDEALNSNQATYKPCSVFSAGNVKLVEELEDGRMGIIVNFESRLKLKQEQQTLPFSIWACEFYDDQPLDAEALVTLNQTHDKIMHRLSILSHDSEQFQKTLSSERWQKMSALDFSFKINALLMIPPEIKQSLLEMTEPQQRLDLILEMLNTIQQPFGE